MTIFAHPTLFGPPVTPVVDALENADQVKGRVLQILAASWKPLTGHEINARYAELYGTKPGMPGYDTPRKRAGELAKAGLAVKDGREFSLAAKGRKVTG